MSKYDTRYIHPFLNGLFDSPDGGMFLHWTNDMKLESRKNEDLWTCHPDVYIASLKGVKWSTSHGYGEAKSAIQEAKNILVCRDLIRVAIFCKNAFDTQNLDGILGLQIVGRKVTIYILVLTTTGVYIMYELGSVKLPNTLHELPKLLIDMPSILHILDVFDRLCIRSTNPPQLIRHHPTVSISIFNRIFSSSQDRKRPCHLKQYHN